MVFGISLMDLFETILNLIQMKINIFYHLCFINVNDGLRDEKMRSIYFDPIKQFFDKIDQLLDALNRTE
jgi:hypothetical protein